MGNGVILHPSGTLCSPPDEASFEVHECRDAEEFFDLLRPRLDATARVLQMPAIYRGQADAEHHLVPSALRRLRRVSADMLVFHELLLLRDFVSACDRTGVSLPGDGPAFRASLDHNRGPAVNKAFKEPAQWPLKEHWEVWAVAQHHGIPTRLLDWTQNPIAAAYFAAAPVVRGETRSESLSVWALEEAGEPVWRDRLAIVHVPTSRSPNLAAQAGLFTVLLGLAGSRGQHLQVSSVEDVVRAGRGRNTKPEYTPLHKFVLPSSEAPKLLEICELYGVSGATMFPGLDGAARATLERRARFEIQQQWDEREEATAPTS
jgi:hypothetical protein